MTDQALWALGRGTGIVALTFFTLSLVLGIIVRSGRPIGTLPRFGVLDVHRFAALFAVVLMALHVLALLADPYAQLRIVDVVLPFLGTYRPVWLGLGTLAADIAVALILTSLLRHRLGPRVFRAVHWIAYLMWPFAVAHVLGNGTDVGHTWFLVWAGVCVVAVAASLVWRMRPDHVEYSGTRIALRR
ncbi:MAG: ferric reductase-like transmembrane domain-containing protein [Mycobacterium sp.]|nr:ferric reductase-like transmembrane domain-containing protein [Mycobacterium sp.]